MLKFFKIITIALLTTLLSLNIIPTPKVNAEQSEYLKIEGTTQFLSPKNLNQSLFNVPETYYVKLAENQTMLNHYIVTYKTPSQEITGCISKSAIITKTNTPIMPIYLTLSTTFLDNCNGYEFPTTDALYPAITFSKNQIVYFIGTSENELVCVEYEKQLFYVPADRLTTISYPRLVKEAETLPPQASNRRFQIILTILITVPSIVLVITLFSSRKKPEKY